MRLWRWGAVALILALVSFSAFPLAGPTVCVIVPEEDRCIVPRPVPDPACETAIIRAFLSYGFNVVDQTQVQFLRATDPGIITRAANGDLEAIRSLSTRFAADILVLGEAYAEGTQAPGQFSIQAARSMGEVRVIEAATGRILAADRLHTGGIDIGSCELAGKKALERAGVELAPRLAHAILSQIPDSTIRLPPPPTPKLGVTPFQCQVSCPRTFLTVLATAVETALSEQGCRTVQPLASDFVVTGVITDYKEIRTPVFGEIWRGVGVRVTVDVQVFDLDTAEIKAYEVTAEVSGAELFGLQLAVSPRDIARAVAQQIAARLAWQCQGG